MVHCPSMSPSDRLYLLAAFVQQTQPPLASTLMWLGAILSGIRRHHPIGGWLFFFFWQIAAGIAVLVLGTRWALLAPRAWTDQGKYFAYALTMVPRMALLGAIAAVCVALLQSREWRWVVTLRYLLILFTTLGLLSAIVNRFYFPGQTGIDMAAVIFPGGYAIYFFRSARVRRIFAETSPNSVL
jgi:hypothetical protein